MIQNAHPISNKDCTVIINSCDNYEDVWLPFFSAFKEMWPDCDCRIVLNTEHKSFSFEGLHIDTLNLSAADGKKPWGWRLRKALSMVDTPFVIALFDDFILEAPVNKEKLARCIQDMKNNAEISVFYFNNIPGVNSPAPKHDAFELIGSRNDYRLNSAPALWRTQRLLNFTGELDSPWAWEFFGSARTYSGNDQFYCAQIDKEDTFIYNYKMGGAIRRGKWVSSVILPAVKKYNLAIDLEQRGIASESLSDGKYSLKWKIDFFLLGFKMIRFGAFIFLYRVLIKKLSKRFQRYTA
ncbi:MULTISPECIES: hypothetical protein [Pseudomonas]|uniref:Uncharacterized protein n=1 Tax=Pseudomonas tritici TaxID=2745518 RepID=A0A8H9YTE0_9PSED|nr:MULTISPECIES: hypothetical protein [Pseudomonas]MBP2872106.1 hypothetical protein [Pseudomonas sp. SWRI144]QXH85648.1 hypothetical protein HU722_0009270 [Pseudomonas tritici]CRM57522.1 hypothetical protein [Pseudomonas sp. 52 E 6]